VSELVTSSGSIAAQSTYDPYGNKTLVTGTLVSDIGYAGYVYHAASALNFTRYCAYDAAHARWINRDPIAEMGGVNLYAYVSGNPVTLTDSSGLFASPWHYALTFAAAYDAGYSVGGSLTIAWYSVTTDIGTQGIADANIHGMAQGGPDPQSVEDAQAGSQAYIDSQLDQ